MSENESKQKSSLAGRSVLLCRPAHRVVDLRQKLEDKGAHVDIFEPYEIISSVDEAKWKDVESRWSQYQWLVLTSPHGADQLVQIASPDLIDGHQPKLAVVGEKALRILKRHFPDWTATIQGKGLAELVKSIGDLGGGKALHVTSRQSLEVIDVDLPERVDLDRVPVYSTAGRGEQAREELTRLLDLDYAAVLFGSPTTYDYFVEAGGEDILEHADKVVTLGPTTARYIEEKCGEKPVIAPSPDVDDLVAVMEGDSTSDQ